MRSQRGFTLIEVLVALAILVGGILMVSLAWSGNFLKMRKSALAYNVATLLERKMVEIDAKYRDKLNELPENGEEGDFGEDFPQFRWELKVHKMKFPDISALLIGREEGADEALISMVKQMTEYMDRTVKEVKVIVYAKVRGKELQYSATQYMIDYTQDFMGGAGGGATPNPAGGGAGGAGAGGAGGGGDAGGGD